MGNIIKVADIVVDAMLRHFVFCAVLRTVEDGVEQFCAVESVDVIPGGVKRGAVTISKPRGQRPCPINPSDTDAGAALSVKPTCCTVLVIVANHRRRP